MDRSRWRTAKFVLTTFAFVLVILVLWVGFDLFGPHKSKMRNFDPDEVARLETAMWRSYYGRQQLRLFNQLAEATRTQFGMPLVRSKAVAYRAAKAAFVFKDGHSRADYEKALPDLVRFYSSIRQVSDIPFDPKRAAQRELEWWIIHRERAHFKPKDLVNALAALQAELYQVPVDRLQEHARLRAEAMRIRDLRADEGGVTEEDWKRIEQLLRGSWQSLSRVVNGGAIPEAPTAPTAIGTG